jgi:hypothetical protein
LCTYAACLTLYRMACGVCIMPSCQAIHQPGHHMGSGGALNPKRCMCFVPPPIQTLFFSSVPEIIIRLKRRAMAQRIDISPDSSKSDAGFVPPAAAGEQGKHAPTPLALPEKSPPPKLASSPGFCSRQHGGRPPGAVVVPTRGVEWLSVCLGIGVDSKRVGNVPTVLALPEKNPFAPSQLVRQASAVDSTGAVSRGWWWVWPAG